MMAKPCCGHCAAGSGGSVRGPGGGCRSSPPDSWPPHRPSNKGATQKGHRSRIQASAQGLCKAWMFCQLLRRVRVRPEPVLPARVASGKESVKQKAGALPFLRGSFLSFLEALRVASAPARPPQSACRAPAAGCYPARSSRFVAATCTANLRAQAAGLLVDPKRDPHRLFSWSLQFKHRVLAPPQVMATQKVENILWIDFLGDRAYFGSASFLKFKKK